MTIPARTLQRGAPGRKQLLSLRRTTLSLAALKGRASLAAIRSILPAVVLVTFAPSVAAADATMLERYQRAEAMLAHNLVDKVLNTSVQPNWIDGGKAFWYRRQVAQGRHSFVRVQSATGVKAAAFDHASIAHALSVALKRPVAADALPFDAFAYVGASASTIRFTVGSETFTCAKSSCSSQAADARRRDWLYSPDTRKALFTRDHNLWIVDIARGAERPITTDGVEGAAWADYPDLTYREVAARQSKTPRLPGETYWSPASDKVLTRLWDERGVTDYPLVAWAPANGQPHPQIHDLKVPFPGDRVTPKARYAIFDSATGQRLDLSIPYEEIGQVRWSADGRKIWFLAQADEKTGALVEVDVASGAVRTLIEEKSPVLFGFNNSYYNPPNVHILESRGEVVWFSERSGFGHLYLYDLKTGRQKSAITQGDWLVRDIVRVDEPSGLIYFTASGRRSGDNPYHRRLTTARLAGGALTDITPEEADHEFTHQGDEISPDNRVFVDNASTLTRKPQARLRRIDGTVIADIETADDTALRQTQWRPPTPFKVKALDGTTDLYGALYLPRDFDPKRRYRVIEHIYAGNQLPIVPHTYRAGYANLRYMQSLAELGFAVVVVDSRGTPQRSKAFQDYGHPVVATALDEHRAVITQLAAQHPYLDLTGGVGIVGHSLGGYTSARAVLQHPDFYTVAASSAGSYNYQATYPVPRFVGQPLYADGGSIAPDETTVAPNLAAIDNGRLAHQLRGKLMLAYGDLDENVYQTAILQFAAKLIEANKDFDLLYLPNRDHNFFRTDPYYIRKVWDHFTLNMLGQQPPEYKIEPFTVRP